MIFQFSGDNIKVFARSGKLHSYANILKGLLAGIHRFIAELDSAVSLTLQSPAPRYYNFEKPDSLLPKWLPHCPKGNLFSAI